MKYTCPPRGIIEVSLAIQSVEDLIVAVRDDSSDWHPKEPKWFRGEPDVNTALTPTLYRGGFAPHENALLQMFRARASGFHETLPMREHTDQWLFLARHANLPTRLLDWSEGALIALHFALKECKPVVWMLNPLDLNDLSYTTLPSRHARENSLSLGMAPAIPLSKTSVGLGSRIAAACHFRWLFIQLTFILD